MDSERTYRLELERRTYGIGHVANGNTIRIPRIRRSSWRDCFSPDFITALCTLLACVFLWLLVWRVIL